jgi:hypothetical protein
VRRRLVVLVVGLVALALLVVVGLFLATSDLYPVARFRCWVTPAECPVTVTESAQAIGHHLVRVIEEPVQFWIFYLRGDEIIEEVEYVTDTPLRVLPTDPDESVLIFSNYPFSSLIFPWEAWDELPESSISIQRWQNSAWQSVKTATTGRVPAGPPDIEGYSLAWDCRWYVSDATQAPAYYRVGYGALLSTSGHLPPETKISLDIRPCVPTWDAENSEWEVIRVERFGPCDNQGISGWSGKMLQVWVEDQVGDPLQSVEVRFTTEQSYGIAWDRRNIGGWTSRFGLIEWNHLGVATRYELWMEDDREVLVWNFRTDLYPEYCRPAGTTGGWRPPNRPGWFSYAVWIRRRVPPLAIVH